MDKVYLNQVTNYILSLDKQYDFRRIYLDDEGLGVGVLDYLVENDQTKRKTVAINNSKRIYEYDSKSPKGKRLLKSDLYNNLKMLMEQGRIQLLKDSEIFLSLKSVQYEFYNEDKQGRLRGSLKIFGNDTHLCESIIRSVWCVKDKSLSIWITSI